jgi:hypothetical protein
MGFDEAIKLESDEHLSQTPEAESVLRDFGLVAIKSGITSSQIDRLTNDPDTTANEKSRLDQLKFSLFEAIGDAYKKYKQSLQTLPSILFSDVQADKTGESEAGISLDNMGFAVQFVDYIFGGECAKTLNLFESFYNQRKDGQMSPEEIKYRQKIADNIHPFGYGVTTVFPALYHMKADDKPYSKENVDERVTRSKDPAPPMFNQALEQLITGQEVVKHDLFRKYLGLPMDYDVLHISKDKPTKTKSPDAQYITFDADAIVKSMLLDGRFEVKTFEDLLLYVQKNKFIPPNSYTSTLGNYIVDQGYDQARGEKYISYYDFWDIDPPLLKDMGIDLDKYNFPFEIYGRIYESDFNKNLT